MPRIVEIRPSYSADSQYLFRLAQAIELDIEQPAEWRQQVMIKIYEMISLLTEANQRKLSKELRKL